MLDGEAAAKAGQTLASGDGGTESFRAPASTTTSGSGAEEPLRARELRAYWAYRAAVCSYYYGTIDFVSVYIVDQSSSVAKTRWCARQFGLGAGSAGYDACVATYWAVNYTSVGTCVGSGLSSKGDNASCVEAGGTWGATWITEAGLVPFFGLEQNFLATFSTATTVSVIIQLVLLIFLGALGDFGGARRLVFVVCNVAAALAVALIFPFGATPSTYQFNASMTVIASTALSFASVLYNSWLPLMVRNHWDVLALRSPSASELYARTNLVTNAIVGRAVSLMFVAVVAYLLLSAGLFIGLGPELGDDVTVRIVCLVCAAWMSLLVTWTVAGMPARPGPPVPRGHNIVTASARRMLRALPRVWHSRQATIFLGSYFIWSDGVSTLSGAAAVFASQELKLGFSALIIAYICTAVASLISSLLLPWLAQRCGIASKRILLANLLVMGLIPIYATFALTSEPEFYAVTFVFGLMNGSAQVFGMSLYSSNIVMRGRSSEYFALWQIVAQGSAWIGPLLLSLVSTQTGSFRTAFACLAALLLAGMAVLCLFDSERAAQEKSSAEDADDEMRELTAANTT